MGKNENKGGKAGKGGGHVGLIIVAIIATACVVCVLIYLPQLQSLANPTPPATTGVFSLEVIDGKRNIALDPDDFDAQWWMFPSSETDFTDWSLWDQDTDVNDLGDIDVACFDPDYKRFVVIYNGTSALDDDDDGDDTNIVFYSRQAEVYNGRLNTLYAYETPSNGAGLIALNLGSGAFINMTSTNITTAVNFTIYAGLSNMSATAQNQAYVGYWDFTANNWARLSIVITFNETCNAAEVSGSNGLTRTHPTTTTLDFAWDYLDVTPQVFNFHWRAAAAGILIDCPIIINFAGVAV